MGRNLLSSRDFDKHEVIKLFCEAERMRRSIEVHDGRYIHLLDGMVLGLTIFENSTRTHDSFVTAAHRLGGTVTGGRYYKHDGSSGDKGESDHDTFQTDAGYSDIIAVRHKDPTFVKVFAPSVCRIPIINAGNGSDEHPTQTLLDWYCIARRFGCLNNPDEPDFSCLNDMTFAIAGDLKYGRTVYGNLRYAQMFGMDAFLASPPELMVDRELDIPGLNFSFAKNMEEALADCNIFYMTRIQRERFPDWDPINETSEQYNAVAGSFRLNRELYERVHPDVNKGPLVLHPMPRVENPEICELSPGLDDLPVAAYFEQSAGGVPTRMALIADLLGLTGAA